MTVAINAQGRLDLADWLRRGLVPGDPYLRSLFDSSKWADVVEAFALVVDHPSGWVLRVDTSEVFYQTTPCKAFDCYHHYLSRRDVPSGRTVWRHAVPRMELPVYPFVTDSGVIFIAERPAARRKSLIVVDVETGHVRAEFLIPDEGGEFSALDPPTSWPYYWKGFVVLRAFRDSGRTSTASRSQDRVPANIVVFDLRDLESTPQKERTPDEHPDRQ